MSENMKTEWSLWEVEGLGTLLVATDKIRHEEAVLIARAQYRLDGDVLSAVTIGREPRGFELVGEGAFPGSHATALRNHLEVFGLDPDDLEVRRRLDPKGLGYNPTLEILVLADVAAPAMGMR
jgi:hypothetical protein